MNLVLENILRARIGGNKLKKMRTLYVKKKPYLNTTASKLVENTKAFE